MLVHFQINENDNIENLNNCFKNDIKKIYNFSSLSMLKINIQTFEVNETEKEILFNHLLVSKMIGQMALNLLHNSSYYTPLTQYTENVVDTIDDKEDKKIYKHFLEKLFDTETCDKISLTEIIKSSFIIYLTVFKVLQELEESVMSPLHKNSEVTKSLESQDTNEDGDTFKDFWKCSLCNTKNDYKMTKCKGCEEIKSEAEKTFINGQKYFEGEKSVKHELDNTKYDIKTKTGDTFRTSNKEDEEPGLVRWTCGKCTMMNVYEDELCKACRECGPHYDKWRCGQCTMINDKLEDDCQACHQRNPIIKTCPHCHVRNINRKYDKMCEECRVKACMENKYDQRHESLEHNGLVNTTADNEGAPVEKWSCSKCSLFNSYEIEVCAACENYGPLHHKWRCSNCTVFNHWYQMWCLSCGFKEYFVFKTKPYLNLKALRSGKKKSEICIQRNVVKNERSVNYYKLSKDIKANHTQESDEHPLKNDMGSNWNCSWKECWGFNDNVYILCTKCFCYRFVLFNRKKCKDCGWNSFQNNNCQKCAQRM